MRLALIYVSACCCLLSSLSDISVGAVRRALATAPSDEGPLSPKAYALALTNFYRGLHENTDPLTSGPLEVEREYTQTWADRLQYAPVLEHSGYTGLGENIAFVYGNATDAGARDAIKEAYRMFYDEEVQDYYDNVAGAVTGHFTQIVWRASRTMTFAYTRDPQTGRYAIVAHFIPQGNVFGEFAANVGPRRAPMLLPQSPIERPQSPIERPQSPAQPAVQRPAVQRGLPPPPPPSTCEVIVQDAIRCRRSGGNATLRLG